MTGRPPKYKTAEELEKKIEEYWDELGEKPTITGLALFLGFESRQSFYKYELDGEFSYTIKRARLKIESIYEQNLHSGNPSGSIFALKNFGWTDKHEVEHKGPVRIIISYQDANDRPNPMEVQTGSNSVE